MQKLNSTTSAIDLLLTRRSVVAVNMTAPGPNKNELKQILLAGIRVPDHGKIAPWRIQVLGSNTRQKLVDLQTAIFNTERKEESPKKLALLTKITLNSPSLLVVSSAPDLDKLIKVPLLEQQLSGGAVCQNILIAAHSIGYVAQWLTAWPAYHSDVKKLLGHNSDTEILGFIHIGTAINHPSERERPDYEKIVSYLD